MCRSIKTLHNFAPPATDDEIHASALQFVRKLSGFTRPSKVNEAAFERAVDQVTHAAHELLDLVQHAVDGSRQRIELVVVQMGGQPMREIAMNDRRNRLPDAVDARHERASGYDADQEPGYGQDGDGAGQSIPEALFQRRE